MRACAALQRYTPTLLGLGGAGPGTGALASDAMLSAADYASRSPGATPAQQQGLRWVHAGKGRAMHMHACNLLFECMYARALGAIPAGTSWTVCKARHCKKPLHPQNSKQPRGAGVAEEHAR